MASANLTVSLDNDVFTITPGQVSPAGSVAVSGTGSATEVSLTPQTADDDTFTLTFAQGTGITSLSSLTVPIPFGQGNSLEITPPSASSPIVLLVDAAQFQTLTFSFEVGYVATGTTEVAFEDPTITFNPPSTITAAQLEEAPVTAEPVMV